LLHIEGKKAEFALALTHRDYLGALMALGYKREMIGDIVVVGKEAYAYVFTSIASEIQKNLLSVGAMRVKVSVLAPQDIEVSPSFTERLINVASLRLDAIIGEVYHLDRNSSKEAILHQEVSVSGVFTDQASLLLKGNERITYKGHGKFQYLGEVGTSRKGRILAKVKIYR
jgi:RNA-binding protein YlmH